MLVSLVWELNGDWQNRFALGDFLAWAYHPGLPFGGTKLFRALVTIVDCLFVCLLELLSLTLKKVDDITI